MPKLAGGDRPGLAAAAQALAEEEVATVSPVTGAGSEGWRGVEGVRPDGTAQDDQAEQMLVAREQQGAPADEWFTDDYFGQRGGTNQQDRRSAQELDELQLKLVRKPGMWKLYSQHETANAARTRRAQLRKTKRWSIGAYFEVPNSLDLKQGYYEFKVVRSTNKEPLVEAGVPVGRVGLFIRYVNQEPKS